MTNPDLFHYAAELTYRISGDNNHSQTVLVNSEDSDLMERQRADDNFGEFVRQALADDGDFDWLLDGDNNYRFELEINALIQSPEEMKGFKHSNPTNLCL